MVNMLYEIRDKWLFFHVGKIIKIENHFLCLLLGLFNKSIAFFDFASISWILAFIWLLFSSFYRLFFTLERSLENYEWFIDLVSICTSKLSREAIFFSLLTYDSFKKLRELLWSSLLGADILEREVGLFGSLINSGYISLFFCKNFLKAWLPADSWCQLLFSSLPLPSCKLFLMFSSSVGRVVFLS